jgi:hypothetical protein
VPSLDLPLPPQQAVVPPEEARPSVSSAPKTLINAPSVGPTSPKSPSMPSASVPVTTRDPVAPPDALEVTSTPPEVTSTPLEVTSTPLEVTSTPPGVTSTPPGVTSTPPGVTSTPLGVPAAASEAKLTVLSFGPSAGRVPSAPENAPSPPYEAPSTALGGQVSALLLLSTSPEVPSEGAPLPFAPPPAKSHAPADASPSQSLSPESHRESIDAPASMSDSPPVRAEAPPMHTALEPHYPEESLAEIPLQRAPIMPVAVVAGILVVGAAVGLYAASRSPGTGSSVAPGSSGLDVTMELDGAPVDAEAATRDAGPDAGAAGEVSPGAGVQRDASPAKPRGWPPHTPPRGHMPPPKPVKHPTH